LFGEGFQETLPPAGTSLKKGRSGKQEVSSPEIGLQKSKQKTGL